MDHDETSADLAPAALQRAIFGIYMTHALQAATRHGLFARLIEAGPSDAPTLAQSCELDTETVRRLLVLLVASDVVVVDRQGRYRLPAAAAPYLDPKDPRYLGGFLDHLVTGTAEQLPRVGDYLRSGKARADEGRRAPFEEIYADQESVRAFVTAMWQLSYAPSLELVHLADLGRTRHLVDVGGANGPFAVAALQAWPSLRATVFDLPAVGPELLRSRDRYGLQDRLSFVPGNFFTDELPRGDCVAFGYILSDWTDEVCVELLRKAHSACTSGGRVLIMERLFDEDGHRPLATAAMNLSMHVETEGRHRTFSEYAALLRRSGFAACELRRSGGDKHLIIGSRAGS